MPIPRSVTLLCSENHSARQGSVTLGKTDFRFAGGFFVGRRCWPGRL
jgi:hypothetical protein